MHQSQPQRFVSAQPTSGQKQVARAHQSHHASETQYAFVAVTEAQLAGRHREHCVVGAKPHVAARCEIESAAYAIAADHRNGRFTAFIHCVVRRLVDVVVVAVFLRVGAYRLETRNVRARGKRFFARTRDDDDPDRRIVFEIAHHRRHCFGHIHRNRVVLGGIIKNNPANRAVGARDDAFTFRIKRDHLPRSTNRLPARSTRARAPGGTIMVDEASSMMAGPFTAAPTGKA